MRPRSVILWLLLAGTIHPGRLTAAEERPAAPEHRVAAMYFHRTHRCPTCRKISEYIEEAVKTGFARQVEARSVRFTLIDYQDPKNEKYVKGYKINAPTLVLADVHGDKVTAYGVFDFEGLDYNYVILDGIAATP